MVLFKSLKWLKSVFGCTSADNNAMEIEYEKNRRRIWEVVALDALVFNRFVGIVPLTNNKYDIMAPLLDLAFILFLFSLAWSIPSQHNMLKQQLKRSKWLNKKEAQVSAFVCSCVHGSMCSFCIYTYGTLVKRKLFRA